MRFYGILRRAGSKQAALKASRMVNDLPVYRRKGQFGSAVLAMTILASPLLFAILLAALPPGGDGPFNFENMTPGSGVNFRLNNSATESKHQIEAMIGGVALFDYNNDGLLDIFIANGAQLPGMDKSDPRFWNRLYRNNGDGTYTDVTEAAGVRGNGYSMGVAIGDFDNDGWEDIYVTGVDRNQLLHNNHDGTFTDVTEKAGVTGIIPGKGKAWSTAAGWFDYDNDGRLDLLVVNYVRWSIDTEQECRVGNLRAYCSPSSYQGLPNILYHNNGDGTFTDVSESSGIGEFVGKGMGVAFADYDNDGWPDVFISNDTYRNFLFHNEHNGTFRETAVMSGVAYNYNGRSIAGMGVDFRDLDNDGLPDIFVVEMIGDTFPLFHNTGKDFEDITAISGMSKATLLSTAWSTGAFDFDNDGNKDLFASRADILDNADLVVNRPAKLINAIYQNLGGNKFVDVSAHSGPALLIPAAHRGAAFGDLNNDGKIDVVVTCMNDKPEILMNRSRNNNHWLLLDLEGTKSNRDGLGTRIKIEANGVAQYNHATTSVGYGDSSDRRVHFGLGKASMVQRIEIRWPSGTLQVLTNVTADQILKVREVAK